MTKEEFKDYYIEKIRFLVQKQVALYQQGFITLSALIEELKKIDEADASFWNVYHLMHNA